MALYYKVSAGNPPTLSDRPDVPRLREMSRREQLRSQLAQIAPRDHANLFRIGLEALDHDLHEQVAAMAERVLAGAGAREYRLWQLLGLARRGMLDCAAAHEAFTHAEALAPADPLVAHSRARTALEAGWPSAGLFARARALAPGQADVILGQAAAQMADGDPAGALALLAGILTQNPGWIDGYSAYARISRMHFPEQDFRAPLLAAIRSYPQDPGLALNAIRIALEAQAYPAALASIAEMRARLGDLPELRRLEAIALSDGGCPAQAYEIFASLPEAPSAAAQIHPVRALIRLGRFDEAARLAERRFEGRDDRNLWPYRALLWRMLGDERWAWLEGEERLISVFDLPFSGLEMDQLAAVLRGLHGAASEPLGQSVRRGSQTDGNLFARAEPEIRQLREAVLDALRAHVDRLPPFDPDHPTLSLPRDPLRFAGAWSIRLSGHGHHVDHVHLEGWLSGSFYVAVPGAVANGSDEAGCIAFGENRQLLPDLHGFRVERPKVGRLVLFPSLLWHGTREITAGERMTVAFDMALRG